MTTTDHYPWTTWRIIDRDGKVVKRQRWRVGDLTARSSHRDHELRSIAERKLKRLRYKQANPIKRYKVVSASFHAAIFLVNVTLAVVFGLWLNLGVAFLVSGPLAVYEWRKRRG